MTEQEIGKYLRDRFPGYDKMIKVPECVEKLHSMIYMLGKLEGMLEDAQGHNQMFKGYNAVSIKQ